MNSKKKILILTPAAPYPLRSGADLAQEFFLQTLPDFLEIHFCTAIYDQRHWEKFRRYKDINPKLIYHVYDARPKIFSILKIKMQLTNLLRRNHKMEKDISTDYCPYPKSIDSGFVSFVKSIINQHQIDCIQFEMFPYTNISDQIHSNIKKIMIHHEIWFKAVALRAKHSVDEIKKLQEEELNLLKEMDAIVVFNDEDKNLLEMYLDKALIFKSPFGIPSEEIKKKEKSEEFDKLLFIGGGIHIANQEGLSWFLDQVYIPTLNENSKDLFIIGKWDLDFQKKYSHFPKIRFEGIVEDLQPYFDKSIMIVPIVSGSGLRTKIMTALANKVPVITTKFAAEGLYSEAQDNHLLFFKDAETFSEIMETSQLNEKIGKVADMGFEYYQEHFSERYLMELRKKVYEDRKDK